MNDNREKQQAVLYTIGHSNHEIEKLIELLRQHEISVVADVRSSPYSAYTSQFNREHLQAMLKQADIAYVFMGEQLGARRSEQECFVEGKVRFELVGKMPAFIEGLSRLRKGIAEHRVALMCSEKDPLTCHRTLLICRNLRGESIAIRHILEDGTIETHEAAESRLLDICKLPPGDLFDGKDTLIEDAYNRQGERCAFVDLQAEEEEL